MLRITVHEDGATWKMSLSGKLAGSWVAETESVWRQAPRSSKHLQIDLSEIICIDRAGQRLLGRMYKAGARLLAKGVATAALVDEIAKKRGSRMKSFSRVVPAVVVVLLALSKTLSAEETPGTPLRLSLRGAVSIALNQNPQVAIANLNLAESQESKNIARAALLPSASFSASETVTRENIAAVIGRDLPGPRHAGPFWTMQAGPSFSVPLFDLTLWEKWRASKENIRASDSDRITAREQNVQLVVSQYLGALRAQADVTAAKSQLELAKALLDLATDQLKSGVGTKIDMLRANVQYQNERQRTSDIESRLKIALYGLSRLLNVDPARSIELSDAASFFETAAFDRDETVAGAYEERPELRAVLAQIKQAEFQKRAAKAGRLPRLSISGAWTLYGLTPTTMVPTYQMGASLEAPLFTGGRIKAETAAADLEIRKLEQAEQDLRNQIAQEVKTSLAQIEAARVEVEAANIGVSEAKEEVTQAEDRFRAGVSNNIEVITAQDELARANDNQTAALYNYNQSRADLARATGRMEAIYSK